MTDEMKLEIGVLFLQRRKFFLRLLHAVFAENALAFFQQCLDLFNRLEFADRDERDGRLIAFRLCTGVRNLGFNFRKAHQVPDSTNAVGAGSTTFVTPLPICSTASPRSDKPSVRKRK